MIGELKEQGTYSESMGVPQIMVLTPDTQVVVDVVKGLKAKYTEEKEVRVIKLFSKHISIEEHQKMLSGNK